MECAKCHRDRDDGQTYSFHYGTKTHSHESFDLSQFAKIKRTFYHVAGQDSAWICDRCSNRVFTWYLRTFLVFSPLFLVVLIIMAFASPSGNTQNTFLGGLVCCGLPWLAIGGVLFTQKGRMRAASGERYAISVNKKTLENQGYNTFFTTAEYGRLEW